MNKNNYKPNTEDFVFGTRAVLEAIEAGKEINKILLLRGGQNPLLAELKKRIQELDLPFQYAPEEKFQQLARGKNHQGVLAMVSPCVYEDLENLVPILFEQGKTPLFLFLDQITDVRNFGAIARSAEVFGVDALIIPQKGGALVTSDAIKTSAGALHRLPVCRVNFPDRALKFLKESGFFVVACTEKTPKHISEVKLTGPLVMILGSEDEGISPKHLEIADAKGKIPMLGGVGSLNVSVAAGIALYQAQEQRSKNA
jgi:23S rRNA (guanosine2251-2'-O)-methyltransferase